MCSIMFSTSSVQLFQLLVFSFEGDKDWADFSFSVDGLTGRVVLMFGLIRS